MIRSFRSSIRPRDFVVEILLIFIAISLAVQFENWNEDRRRRIEEVSLLRSIRDELLQDTVDISQNINAYRHAITRDSTILSQLTNREPIDPGTAHFYQDLLHQVDFTYHNAAYANLASRGLDLISNRSLRNKIVALYSFEYKRTERLENEGSIEKRRTEIAPYFYKHFQLDASRGVVPSDYEALLEDRGFHLLLSYALVNKRFLHEHYARLLSRVKALVRDISSEIGD